MTYKETTIKIIKIMDMANKYRLIAKNPKKKKDIPAPELEGWYKSIIECAVTKKLIPIDKDTYKLECQALIKFKDVISPYRIFHLQIDKIKRNLNMMISKLDIFYPVLYRRYFQIPYDKTRYREVLKNIIQ